MAEETRVDDLGIPIRSRTQIWNWLREHDDTISAKAMPLLNSEYSIEQHNTILTRAIRDIIPNVRRYCYAKQELETCHIYAITLTTPVTDGKPLKGYTEFMVTLKRIKDLPGVYSIKAYFELTQQNALHVHAVLKSTKYLDTNKVRKYNSGHHVKVNKMKGPKAETAALTYASKELDNRDCLRVMRYANSNVSSTYIEL